MIEDVVGLGKTLMAEQQSFGRGNGFKHNYLVKNEQMAGRINCPRSPNWSNSFSRAVQQLNVARYKLVLMMKAITSEIGKAKSIMRYEVLKAKPSDYALYTLRPIFPIFPAAPVVLTDGWVYVWTLLRTIGGVEFNRRHQGGARTLEAFEKVISRWLAWTRRLYLVRRTRSFILDNYSE